MLAKSLTIYNQAKLVIIVFYNTIYECSNSKKKEKCILSTSIPLSRAVGRVVWNY